MAFFKQFWLLVWKNFVLQKRRKWGTVFELALPTFFIVILCVLRHITLDNQEYRCARPLTSDDFNSGKCQWNSFAPTPLGVECPAWVVGYTPASASELVLASKAYIGNPAMPVFFSNYTSDDAMAAGLLADLSVPAGCRVGFVIEEPTHGNFSVTIRMSSTPGGFSQIEADAGKTPSNWFTQNSFPEFLGQGARSESGNPDYQGNFPGYDTYRFLTWQHAINRALIAATVTNASVLAEMNTVLDAAQINRFPYPVYLQDGFLYAIQFGLPLLLMLSFVFTALNITREIVHEKERRLKESMKMMGLYNAVHWAAWYFKCFVFLLISVIVMTLLMAGGKVLQYSQMSLIFVYLLLFATSTISWCFFVSVFFSKASTAAAVSGIMWFMSYVPYFFITPRYGTMSFGAKQLSCLLSTTGMAMGANVIAIQETNGVGVTWSNFHKANSIDDSFSFATVLGMLIWDTLFYFVLAWYLEQVFPGDFGIPRKFYFPCLPSFWCSSCEEKPLSDSQQLTQVGGAANASSPTFQDEPQGHAGIRIVNLRKEFGTKAAVVKTNLNMYENQITALLGHNGAGKTTTMSIITGLFPPTSGTVFVDGMDIRHNTRRVQETLGICPQHDVLFDTLTVTEHLRFFCKLKGVTGVAVDTHVAGMLDDLQLRDKKDDLSMNLSGGQKRRLSCGIALVGGSKVVILDEPTSGMDPAARRATWELLSRHKHGRTILLSTHFMDEADLLGDRIAIMADGVVKCCGDSMFLKSHYGVGYHLTIVKAAGCVVPAVTEFVSRFVPLAVLEGDVGAELTYLLPREHAGRFADMFDALEPQQLALGIEGYGCSVTTMEEVFLRVGEGSSDPDDGTATPSPKSSGSGSNGGSHNKTNDNHPTDTAPRAINIQQRIEARHAHSVATVDRGVTFGADEHAPLLGGHNGSSNNGSKSGRGAAGTRLTGMALRWQQFGAMLRKRWLHSKRNKMAILTQLIPPLLFTLLSLMISKTFPGPTDSKPRSLSSLPDSYGKNTLWVAPTNVSGFTNALAGQLATAASALVLAGHSPLETVQYVPVGNAPTQLSTNISDFLVNVAGQTTPEVSMFNRANLILLEFAATSDATVAPTAWFNGQAYHAVAEALSLLDSAVLAAAVGGGAGISTTNFPLPRSAQEQAQDNKTSGIGFIIAFNIVFGMAPLASSFVLFLVNERKNKAKLVQFVSGVSPFSYWSSSFLWDYLNYLVPSIGCIILFASFGSTEFAGAQTGYVVLQFLLYGFSVLPLMYLATFLFETPSVAFTRMTLFNIVTGLAAMLTINILTALDKMDIVNTLRIAFLPLPNYCFGQGISDLYSNYQSREIVSNLCQFTNHTFAECCADPDGLLGLDVTCASNFLAWEMPGTGKYLFAMFVSGAGFFAILLAIEYRAWAKLCSGVHAATQGHPLSADVAAETRRVQAELTSGTPLGSDVLLVSELRKQFTRGTGCCGSVTKTAVDGLSFGVPHFECFGLLGVNGAGKTTTFRMLTGDETPDAGTARLLGYDIHTNMTQVRQRMGYCPQFDALIDLMTGREVLTMFAQLRGVPSADIAATVADSIEMLMLEKHADKLTQAYSGGNKRKLSTAIALVGDPACVLLDEPTTGMDPGARRFLWDALCRTRERGCAIVLTSHSMEECEALCTRLGIMVNGQFQCIGSPQAIKSKHGAGVSLMARLPDMERVQELKSYVAAEFPDSELKEEHSTQVKFVVRGRTWAQLFRAMEKARVQFALIDYSVSQTSLEEVFLDFAKHQHDSVV